MRPLAVLLLCAAAAPAAEKTADEPKVVAALEKSGATVTADNSKKAETRLKLAFAKWDNAKGAAVKGSPYVTDVAVEAGASVTDYAMAVFASLPNLERLHLTKPAITNAGLAHFKAHKNLTSLTLTDAKIGDAGVAHLKSVFTLEELDLSGTQITDQSARNVRRLGEMRVLSVSRTMVTGAGIMQMLGPDLKELNAVGCRVAPAEAAKLKMLKFTFNN